VLNLFLREGLSLVTVGIILGLIAAFLAMRAVSSLLFGIGSGDPAAYASTAALLVLVAIVSIYLPARRAAQVDPLSVLRE
jgi:ABC-type antimicrobial peptide transport system permease subunit